jgi:FtsH-binding integral membrane protein
VYGPDDYILAAIDLYLDIINLFVMLLSLFSNRD